MQTSSHFVAKAFFSENCHQCKVDNDAYGQNHGRPCNPVGLVEHMLNQQLKDYTESGNPHEQVECTGQHGKREKPNKQSEYLRYDCDKCCDRKSQMPEP